MVSLRARNVAVVVVGVLVVVSFVAYSYMTKSFYFAERIGEPGEASLDYLRGQPYSHILIEVDHATGRNPSSTALGFLRERLLKYLDKQDVNFDLSEELPVARGDRSEDEVMRLYLDHKNHRTAGDTAAIYVAYLDRKLKDDPNVDGVAFTAKGLAVFPDFFQDAPDQASKTYAETAVLLHEVGHLLGLVNLVYKSDQRTLHLSTMEYEDHVHPSHTTNVSDVMYWTNEGPTRASNRTAPDFGFETARDLDGVKSGRLRYVGVKAIPLGPSPGTDTLIIRDGVPTVGHNPWPRVSS